MINCTPTPQPKPILEDIPYPIYKNRGVEPLLWGGKVLLDLNQKFG
jgi:hypothetical protein